MPSLRMVKVLMISRRLDKGRRYLFGFTVAKLNLEIKFERLKIRVFRGMFPGIPDEQIYH